MAIEITGVPGIPTNSNPSEKTGTENVAGTAQKSGLPSNSINVKQSPAGDSFIMSEQAEKLRAIESTVNAQSDVDDIRVESLKVAIDAGRYNIDPLRVAEKLIELERQFVA